MSGTYGVAIGDLSPNIWSGNKCSGSIDYSKWYDPCFRNINELADSHAEIVTDKTPSLDIVVQHAQLPPVASASRFATPADTEAPLLGELATASK